MLIVRPIEDLSNSLNRGGGEIFSEARAMHDFTILSGVASRWIESHETLRREAQKLRAMAESQRLQIEEFKLQVEQMNLETSKIRRELFEATSQRDRIQRRLEKELMADSQVEKEAG